jgi:hypothetical protein
VQARVPIWDAVVDAGYARVCVGSELSGMVTRYRATGKPLDLRKEWKLSQFETATLEGIAR